MSNRITLARFLHGTQRVGSLIMGHRKRDGEPYYIVALDLVPVLDSARALSELKEERMLCYAKPFPEIKEPPLVQRDVHYEVSRKAKEIIGHAWTKDDAAGDIIYGLHLHVPVIMELFDVVWCHCSSEEYHGK